jgi:hypothetical protein
LEEAHRALQSKLVAEQQLPIAERIRSKLIDHTVTITYRFEQQNNAESNDSTQANQSNDHSGHTQAIENVFNV